VEEWLVNAVMAMYQDARTVVRTTEGNKAFNMKIRLHQGSVLSSLLFVIIIIINILEAFDMGRCTV